MRLQCYELIFFHPHPRQMITGYRTALPFPSCKKEGTELKLIVQNKKKTTSPQFWQLREDILAAYRFDTNFYFPDEVSLFYFTASVKIINRVIKTSNKIRVNAVSI